MNVSVGSRQYAVGDRQGSLIAVGGSPRSTNKPSGATAGLPSSTRRDGFTLIEMLVVIVIIGVLAGLIVTAAGPALRAAKRLTIITEIGQLDMALQKYQQEYGAYPPDFCGLGSSDATVQTNTQEAVMRHLRRAFPRFRLQGTTTADRWNDLRLRVKQATTNDPTLADPDDPNGLEINNMRGPGALVFFLGGVDVPGNSTILDGFSANPANPFAPGGSRKPLLFEFDEERLVSANNVYYYVPPNVKDPDGGDCIPPYVYFKANRDSYDPTPAGNRQSFPWGSTYCTPYGKDAASSTPIAITKWFNPNKCQIICCGLDGIFSASPQNNPPLAEYWVRYLQLDGQPDSGNLKLEEDNNLTNFTEGKLEDWSKGN